MIASSHVCVLFFALDDRLETTVGTHSFVGKDKAKCDKAKCVEIAKFEDYTYTFLRTSSSTKHKEAVLEVFGLLPLTCLPGVVRIFSWVVTN